MTHDLEDRNAPADSEAARNKALPPLRRRGFLGFGMGALALGTSSLGLRSKAQAQAVDAFVDGVAAARPERATQASYRELRRRAFVVRVQAAKQQFEQAIATHATTGDEQRYPNFIGSDTRGLPHNPSGEVAAGAFEQLRAALASESFDQVEQITLGGTRKLVNPIGTLATSLEGTNVTQVAIPAPPALESEERAAEAVEQYWQALLRDVAFSELASHPDAQAAAAELDALPGYKGPKQNGRVTPEVLFRGSVAYVDPSDRSGRGARHVVPKGVLEGPYLPQFLFRETAYGTQSIPALHRVPVAGEDFLTNYEEWLAIQNGQAATRKITFEPLPRYLRTIRDLNEYTHGGSPLFWGAALQLAAAASGTATAPAGIGAPVSPNNPYRNSKTQASANGTFGLGYLQALLNVGGSRAVRASYWQKWFVHRSVRPEGYGGLVHRRVTERADYPISDVLLDSEALARTYEKFGTYLIPHAYPEGAPIHGSYPAGSAATAGVSATLLKAYFDESHVIPNPVTVDPNDPTKLVPYQGPPLTVGGEIDKLALSYTFGRVLSGIHWRSDAAAGLALGEQIAIAILQDERLTIREPFAGFTLTRFDGTKITI